MKTHKHSFEIQRDIKVFGTVYDVAPAVAVLIIVHDVFEHRFLYQPLIEKINSQQIAVVSYDLRGHHNTLEDKTVGHFSEEGLLGDLLEVILMTQREYQNIPITLMGGRISSWLINKVLPLVEVDRIIVADIVEPPKLLRLRKLVSSLFPKRQKSPFTKNNAQSGDPYVGRPLSNAGYRAVCSLLLSEPVSINYPLIVLMLGESQESELLTARKEYYQQCGLYDVSILLDQDASFENIVSFIIH